MNIFQTPQGQGTQILSILQPVAELTAVTVFSPRPNQSTDYVSTATGMATVSQEAPLQERPVNANRLIYDVYLAYLTFQCPALPQYPEYGQRFPFTAPLAGADGTDGTSVELRKTATHLQWAPTGSGSWTNLVALSEITGPPGGTAYEHIQQTPAGVWTINHNLGYYPSVEVFNSARVEIAAGVSHPSVNQTLVETSPPISGYARLT